MLPEWLLGEACMLTDGLWRLEPTYISRVALENGACMFYPERH